MNPLFRSPIDEEKVQNILDLGTGDGAWVCGYTPSLAKCRDPANSSFEAIDAADRYPQAIVRGVDLYPPPQDWVPPNCILEGKFLLILTWIGFANLYSR